MSKTRQIAKNLSKILRDDALTLQDETVLLSKNKAITNTEIEGDFVSEGNSSIIANEVFEFTNKVIGKTLIDTSLTKYNYILLTPALSNTFIVDGEFVLRGQDSIRSFKITANIGVQKTVLAELQNQEDNEFVAYVTYQGTTWVAVQIVADQNIEVLFSGFVSLSNNDNPITVTNSNFVSDMSPIIKSENTNYISDKWENFDLDNVRAYFIMMSTCTLDDGNIFYLEMKSFAANSTQGNNTSQGNGYGSLKNINRAWIINPYTGKRRETTKFPWYPVRGAGCVTIDGGDVLVFFGNSYIANTIIPAPSPLPANYENGTVNGFMGYNKYVYRYSPKTEMWSIETVCPTGYGWEYSHLEVTEDRKQVISMGGTLGNTYAPTSAANNTLIETVKPFTKYPYMYNTVTKKWTQAGKDVGAYKFIPSVNNFITPIAHLSGDLYLVHTFNYYDWTSGSGVVVANNPTLWVWNCKSYLFTQTTALTGKTGDGICPVQTITPILKKISENKVAIIGGYKIGSPILNSEYTTTSDFNVHTQQMTIYDYTTNSFSTPISAPMGIGFTPATRLLDGRIALFQSAITPQYNTTNSAFTYFNTNGTRLYMYDDDRKAITLENKWEYDATIPSNITTVFDSAADSSKGQTDNSLINFRTFSLAITPNTGKLMFGGFYYYDSRPASLGERLSSRWYIYDINDKSITRLANAPFIGGCTPLVAIDDDNFILMGGYGVNIPSPSTLKSATAYNRKPFKYTISTNTWKEMNANFDTTGYLISDGSAITLPNGKIMFGLGYVKDATTISDISNKTFLYNPVSDTLESLPNCPVAMRSWIWHLDENTNRVYVFNRSTNTSNRKIYYFDLIANVWKDSNITINDLCFACGKTSEKGKVILITSTGSIKFDLYTGEALSLGLPWSKVPIASNIARIDPALGVNFKGTFYLYNSFLSNSSSFESYFMKIKI